jgi:hypothetical protein
MKQMVLVLMMGTLFCVYSMDLNVFLVYILLYEDSMGCSMIHFFIIIIIIIITYLSILNYFFIDRFCCWLLMLAFLS